METLENSKVLKLLGLDDQTKWILQDEKAQKFLEYIAANLDESNILTDSEIREYEELQAAGLVLDDLELEKEMKNVEYTFPGFFSVTDEKIQDLEEEVQILEEETRERSERLERMQEYEHEQLKELARIEKENQEVLVQLQLYTEECKRKADELAELQQSNAEKIAQLTEIYIKPQASPSLLYQMPVDQCFQKCNEILSLLEIFMRENFNIKRPQDSLLDDGDEALVNTIHKTKKEIFEVERKKFQEELNVAGMNYIVENIGKHMNSVNFANLDELRAVIDDMLMEKESLEMQLEVQEQECLDLVNQATEQKILSIFQEFYIEKNKRVVERAEKINKVHELTESLVYLCEMLWVGMQLDLKRFKSRVDNSAEMRLQAHECMKRINKMKQMSLRNPLIEFDMRFLEQFQGLLMNHLGLKREQLPTIEKCISEYMSYEEHLRCLIQSTIDQKNFSKVNDVLKQIDAQAKIYRKFIFTGPTNKPCLYNPKFSVQIYEKKKIRKEIDRAYQELRANIQKNIVDPFNNDKFHRMKVLLYLWFMSDQRKVILAIKEVQKKAAEEGSASFKALNITVK